MALAPEWMSYTKESSPSQGARFNLGKERERVPKYGRQLSFSPSNLDLADTNTVPFACSLSSPPAPPHTPASILGDPNPRVLNRSKSSPGFGSPKSKQKKSPDRAFSNFTKPKPKPPKPPLSPTSYMKSQSQPNLLNSDKITNWQQQKMQSSLSSSSTSPSPLSSSSTSASQPPTSAHSLVSSAFSPPLPPSSSPPPILVPEMDKLKTLIPTTAMPPKSVRPRVMVGPPLPLAKKAPSIPAPSSSSSSSSSSSPNGLASFFRKATSEPSLMHHKDGNSKTQSSAQDAMNAARRAEIAAKKLRGLETEKAQGKLLKEAVDSRQPKRKNFFQHVIKQEEQGSPLMEDDSPIGIDLSIDSQGNPYSPATSPPPPSTTPPPPSSSFSSSSSSSSSSASSSVSSPPIGLRSPLPEDMEDEERFMRTLGWVPDEEDPVPVLDEEEMRDVRVKIFLKKGTKSSEGEGEDEDEDVQNMGIGVDVK